MDGFSGGQGGHFSRLKPGKGKQQPKGRSIRLPFDKNKEYGVCRAGGNPHSQINGVNTGNNSHLVIWKLI